MLVFMLQQSAIEKVYRILDSAYFHLPSPRTTGSVAHTVTAQFDAGWEDPIKNQTATIVFHIYYWPKIVASFEPLSSWLKNI